MIEFLNLYWLEFVTLATVHLLAVASPGPDFAIVLRYSITHGRKAAIWASIGIGLGILLHVAYSLLGIGILIKNSPMLFNILMWASAAYLFYIGVMAIRATAPSGDEQDQQQLPQVSSKKAFVTGFITNGLNPKATLFFLSVFLVVVSMDTPMSVKMGYGIYLAFATACWFTMLSFLLSTSKIREKLNQYGYWFDRVMGLVLIALAIKLLIDSL